MTDLDTAIVAHNAMARLSDTHVLEIGPQSNRETDRIRESAYRWARRTGRRVTTSSERVPGDPSMSVLRVRLVEGRQGT